MNYEEYWHENGLETITPRGLENPEGFDIAEVLKLFVEGYVLEIGCGTGRIAKFLDPAKYIGVDINQKAINKAKANCPDHSFIFYGHDEDVPVEVDTALFYTVCLHIPDSLIVEQLARAAKTAPTIVIAEIMNPKYRKPGAGYQISNQRSLEEYVAIMGKIGFILVDKMDFKYAYYPDESITFAKFRRAV